MGKQYFTKGWFNLWWRSALVKFLGKWSNTIGYELGSSPAGVYTTAQTSPVENFEHEWKIDVTINMATLFSVRVLRRSSFSGNLKSSDKTHLEAFKFNFNFDLFGHLAGHDTNRCLKQPCLGLKLLTLKGHMLSWYHTQNLF